MLQEKPKRHPRRRNRSFIRLLLIGSLAIPLILVIMQTRTGQNLLADAVALSVMICAAVYLVHQAILYLVALYLGILDSPQDNEATTPPIID